MSALAEPRALGRIPAGARGASRVGFVSLRIGLVAIYAGYLIVQLPTVLVPVLALMCGLGAVLVFDAPRRAAWCASAAVIAAVLHARVVSAEGPFLLIQVGLAAFVVVSATLSLVPAPTVVRLRWVLLSAVASGALIGAPVGIAVAFAGAIGGLLAGLRPLSALEVIVGREAGARDGWLAWSPLVAAKGGR